MKAVFRKVGFQRRRRFVLCLLLVMVGQLVEAEEPNVASSSKQPPNLLFIAIDDLNDWIEPLGGHPDVQTPNLKRLSERGVTFTNAHCQAPLCNSSRCSVMTSLRPSTTGIYGLAPFFRDTDRWRAMPTINRFFREQGYETYCAGKVFHGTHGRNAQEFDHIGPAGLPKRFPPKPLVQPRPHGNNPWVDWGLFPHGESEKTDYKVATWSIEKMQKASVDRPWMIACGFFQPHVPCYPPPQFWERYSTENISLPIIDPEDRLDCSPFAWYTHWDHPEPRLAWLKEHNHHRSLVHAYLACITFVDAQVGRLLDALDASSHRDNTIVCLWSDHGYHLGEKNMTGKTSLWERSTHVPLMFAGPGIPRGEIRKTPSELLDVFPTLVDLAGFEVPAGLEGETLTPVIADPTLGNLRVAITDHNPGNQSIRGARYRLMHYADGSEEFYDMLEDPREETNLISDPSHADAVNRLRKHLNANMAPLIAGSKSRVLEKTADGWYWQHQRIDPDNPPMDIAPHTSADLPKQP